MARGAAFVAPRPSLMLCALLALSAVATAAPQGQQARVVPEKVAQPPAIAPKGPTPPSTGKGSPPAPGAAKNPGPKNAGPAGKAPPAPASTSPHRYGRFDFDAPLADLARGPFAACAAQLTGPSGHADCDVPAGDDKIVRAQLAWDDARAGGPELIALRLSFEQPKAPLLTELEWQLAQSWGAPSLEQLRREKNHKLFLLQWEDADHRATLDAGAPISQRSRAIALTFERKPPPLPGDLASLRPRPFPGFNLRWVRRIVYDATPHAVVYGTSLTPVQEALGEAGPLWAGQRNYVGIFRLEPPQGERRKRWHPLWDRVTGGEDEEEPQRVLRIDVRDVTGEGMADVLIEFSCDTCHHAANELLLKTVRAGKLVDLLVKRDLFRATVDLEPGRVRIREPDEREDGRSSTTVSTYAYDRSKGAFVLAREEHVEN